MHGSEATDYLQPLLGLQLTSTRRAADLNNFQFGPLRSVDGQTVGSFALHVQCPWRLDGQDGVVTGRWDLWEPADETLEVDWESWDYDLTANLQDARLAKLLHVEDAAPRSTQPLHEPDKYSTAEGNEEGRKDVLSKVHAESPWGD